MSFPNIPITKNKQSKRKYRKEIDSFIANHFIRNNPIKERASTFTSKASMTLEASVVMPIFFFAVLCLACMLEIMSLQMHIHHALHSVGREIAQAAYSSPMISTYGIQQRIIKNIGEEKLEKGMVTGIDCSKSWSDWNTAVIELSVCYDLELPVLFFRIPLLSKEETLLVKGWTGYVQGEEGNGEREMVYVTDYGLVYHKNLSCTYLELSIRRIPKGEAEGSYLACQYCKSEGKETEFFYITEYGDKYHTTLDCSRIKRNIYAVPLEEVYALGGCSKCVK